MQLPDFDHTPGVRKFDRFGEFYNEIDNSTYWGFNANPFILFETGEFIITRGRFNPTMRRFFAKLNISIFASGSDKFARFLKEKGVRLLTPNGEQVLPSWLCQGAYQTLVIDHDANHIVRATWPSNWGDDTADKRIPVRLRDKAAVYWPGENEPPVARHGLDVSEPDKLSKEDHIHVQGLVAACNAWDTLSEEARVPTVNGRRVDVSSRVIHNGNYSYYPNPHYVTPEKFDISKLLNMNFTDMTWGEKKQLAIHGVKSRRKVTNVTHLVIT